MDELAFPLADLVAIGVLLAVFGALHLGVKRFQRVYRRQSEFFSGCQATGRGVADRLLSTLGLGHIQVRDGGARDRYDWRAKSVLLRTETAVSSSVAAVAIATHEVGHAQQFDERYWAARLVPAVWWGSWCAAALPILVLVYDFTVAPTDWLTVVLVLSCAIILLVRAPVVLALERDATRRALTFVDKLDGVNDRDRAGIAEVLNAGFWTHAAFAGQQLACLATALIVLNTLDPHFEFLNANQPHAITVEQVVLADQQAPPAPTVPVGIPGDANLDALFLVSGLFNFAWLLAVGGLVYWATARVKKPARRPSKLAAEFNNAGLAHFHANRHSDALAAIDQAIAEDPNLAMAHYNRAAVLGAMGRTDDAFESLERFTKMPESAIANMLAQSDFWHFRGMLHLSKERWMEADHDFTQALERHPSDPSALLRDRCLARLRLGRTEEAALDGAEAVRLHPDDPIALNNLGVACAECGRYPQAIDLYQKAIRLMPDFPNPHRHLAWLMATCPQDSLRDGPTAVTHATQALELSRWTTTEWFDVLAAAHAESGDFEEAVRWQERHTQTLAESTSAHSQSLHRLEQYRLQQVLRV